MDLRNFKMNLAQKTNLRKLSFLGFNSKTLGDNERRGMPNRTAGSSTGGQQQITLLKKAREKLVKWLKHYNQNKNGYGGGDSEVQLDEECAKVFAMDSGVSTVFDFHDQGDVKIKTKFDEKDYQQHRKNEYPHMHAPLKKGPKSMRRRNVSQETTPQNTPQDTPKDSQNGTPSIDQAPTISPLSSLRSKLADSETGPLNTPLSGDDDPGNQSSDSECVVSDPCNYLLKDEESDSPDKKVSFLNSENRDTFDPDGLKKKRRHQYNGHRKFSLPVEGATKKRHHHHHHHDKDRDGAPEGFQKEMRRVSTQPEDEELGEGDRDQLDSHRSDDPRALRRHKTSLMHIGRGFDLHPFLKKLYDHSPHAIFVELSELLQTNEDEQEKEWKETARWIKYEEDVEEGVDRWGKPHVASLSFHSLLNLRKCLENGVCILDLEEKDLPAIAYRVSEELFKEDLIRENDKGQIMRILLVRHRHVNEHYDRKFGFTKNKNSYTSLQSLWKEDSQRFHAAMMARCSMCSANGQLCAPHVVKGRSYSLVGFTTNNLYDLEKRKISYPEVGRNGDTDHKLIIGNDSHTIDIKEETYSASNDDIRRARNEAILKKIPAEAQGASVLVGEVDFLEQPAIAFVRLAEAVSITSLIEVSIPVRFIFILLGPKKATIDYHEVGRSISTLMANQQFHNIAYKADSRKELLSAINEFLDDSIVLPPGDWERQALLPIEEIKAKSDAIKRRKLNALKKEQEAHGITRPLLSLDDGGDKKPPFPNPLERTGRPWGGLVNDLKRRFPHYKSDITDGLNAQCAAAAIFMYFAAVSGAIAFGGLMGIKTDNQIGISETLLCTCLAGLLFAVFCGQPLIIVGTTGPLLLFDESLFQFCQSQGLEFLTVRLYISLWLVILGIVVAAFEGSVLVKLFSRFTEDIFSALIVLLYIIESIQKIFFLYEKHPILANYCEFELTLFRNASENDTIIQENPNLNISDVLIPVTHLERVPDHDKSGIINQPNTALFCTILTLGTFAIAYYLKIFRNSHFLGRSARRALGDFGVPIAIICMVFMDFMVPEIFTEKLNVPEGLSPSKPELRGWFIPPSGIQKPLPLWIMFAAVVPAMLVYILLFMETHICELILDKKERKLQKGAGFHLDIVLICLTNIMAGFFGMPWMCAATVRSIAHTSALTVMSRTHAPGEKPHLIEVKEQRLSSLLVATLIGLSVFMSPLLRLVPMAVLFGIFLYMGVASTDGIQLFDRLRLFFMPVKHHPQALYVRKVRTAKMHLFTFVQMMCLIVLWVVKSTKASLAFPFFLIMMVPIRNQLKRIFSQRELRALDGDQADADDDEPDFYAEAPLPG